MTRMTEDVAASRPDGIAVICTNLRAAPLVESWERKTGITIYDSIAVVVHQSLELAGEEPAQVKGWGRLFDMS